MSQNNTSGVILDATVKDVENGYYILQTEEGEYKLAVGTVEMENGTILKIDNNKYIKLIINEIHEADDDNINNESVPLIERNVAEWPEAPTKLLIQLYKEKKKLIENRKIKTMKRMWEIIRDEINNYQYNYTAQQCETKWKSLERAFKNKIENNKKTGRGRRTCPYEMELSDILRERKTIFPPVVMDSESVKTQEELLTEAGIETTNREIEDLNSPSTSATCVTPVRNRRKVTNTRQEIHLLKKAIEERNAMQQINEERKFEQRERLIKELKRRNDILEKLVNTD